MTGKVDMIRYMMSRGDCWLDDDDIIVIRCLMNLFVLLLMETIFV